ncbi:MAG: hypothetical protein ACRD1R_10870, partial [Acidobacteriota bacterium]
TSVIVEVGTVAARRSVEISFRVTIRNPLPSEVKRVTNQGSVASNELPTILTDDPSRAGDRDTTITEVTATPVLFATTIDRLLTDADGNGAPSPGDTLVYEVVVTNNGTAAATNVLFQNMPGSNSTLIVGSVQTSQGIVAQGNQPGNGLVQVEVGTIAARSSIKITFQVVVANPLPAGIQQISNQGSVSSDELPTILTDDPSQPGEGDATVTNVTAAPVLEANKSDELFDDLDDDGTFSPGDVVVYVINVTNKGNSPATGVIFIDKPDRHSVLEVGSVQADQGLIVSGNTSGDPLVRVELGHIPAGKTVKISFRVAINNPLPVEVRRISNQASVASNELPTVLT